MARTLCPCGVYVSLPELMHRNRVKASVGADEFSHDCIWHDSTSCRVCITVEQVQDYLSVAAAYGMAEAEQVFAEETKGKRSKGAWE